MSIQPIIINNRLPWDGSHLGTYYGGIANTWVVKQVRYFNIILPHGWCETISGGMISCVGKYITKANVSSDTFQCIVDEIKTIFGLARRGMHRIIMDNQHIILYYAPIAEDRQIIWETPLSMLDPKYITMYRPIFKYELQKLLAFCEVMGLSGTRFANIRVRRDTHNEFTPYNTNEIVKFDMHNITSVISAPIQREWFGDDISISDIVKEMLGFYKYSDLTILMFDIRNKLNKIIQKYDTSHSTYACFVIDRLYRYLL